MHPENNEQIEHCRTPTLIVLCGLPGSGKTTLARRLAEETGGVRLCPDEWLADLGIDLFDEEIRARLEIRLWKLGQDLLSRGHDVVLENGLWTRVERDDKRRDAELLGVRTELHYLDVPLAELVRRLEIRNAAGGHGVVPIHREQIEAYARLFQAPDEAELALFTRAIVHKGGTSQLVRAKRHGIGKESV